TAAEAMVAAAAEGGMAETAKAEAAAQVIAARFTHGTADAPVKALVAVGRKQALDDEGREVLRKAGLVDEAGATPLVERVGDEEVLRRAVLRVVGRRRLEGSLVDLAPGLLPEVEAAPTAAVRLEMPVPAALGKVEAKLGPLPEPSDAKVREAWA